MAIPLIPTQVTPMSRPRRIGSGVPVAVVWVMAGLLAVTAVAVGGLVAKVGAEQRRVQVAQAQASAVAEQEARQEAEQSRVRADGLAVDLRAAQAEASAREANQSQLLTCLSGVLRSYTYSVEGLPYTSRVTWDGVKGTCQRAIDESNQAGAPRGLDDI